MTDSGDLLNGGSTAGFRAPYIPGFGTRVDWGLAAFDIRDVFHFSGGYELPIGKGRYFLGKSGRFTEAALGNWSVQYLVTLQNGQPASIACPIAVFTGAGCNSVREQGQDPSLGIRRVATGNSSNLYWFNNPAAFQQPCQYGFNGPNTNLAGGCIPLTGLQALGASPSTTYGPPFKRADISLFKKFQFTERTSLQFRSEFFNVLNHPNFSSPGFGGDGVVAIGNSLNYKDTTNFGRIGSTRDAPNDPRQIQFALKLYY